MIDRSWPVAQYLLPDLGIDAWREQVRRPVLLQCACATAAAASARYMTVRCPRGYIYGMARYAVAPCEKEGHVLLVDGAVAVALIDTHRPAVALFDGLVAEAKRQGCPVMRVRVPDSRTWLVARLGEGNWEAAFAAFLKCVNAPLRAGLR